MPFAFKRRISALSQRSKEDTESHEAGLASSTSSISNNGRPNTLKTSRSASMFSVKNASTASLAGQSVKSGDLLASFGQEKRQPASRRLTSYEGFPSTTASSFADLSISEPLTTRSGIESNVTRGISKLAIDTRDLKAGTALTSSPLDIVPAVSLASPRDVDSSSSDEFFDTVDDEDEDTPNIKKQPAETLPHADLEKKSKEADQPIPFPPMLLQHAKENPADTPLQADIRQIWIAVSLFLNSRMKDAESILARHQKDRLYYSLGHSLITSMKSLMTFEPADLSHAIELCKGTLELATKEKNKVYPGQKALSWSEKISGGLGGFTRGTSLTVEGAQRMTIEQRHAELAYAECLLLKAVVGLIYAGDFLAFLREALSMRTAYTIYRTLSKYIAITDEKHPNKYDPSLDLDFRSGVNFGNGNISLVFSLLPSQATKVMEIFGFTGKRQDALNLLMSAGGWVPSQYEPTVKEGPGNEGLRRCVCDLTLLVYHLIISSVIPVSDVDIDLADKILHYNLKRYPQGAFFLYFSGRLYSTQTLGPKAIVQYQKAIDSQKEYVQIQHICHWDMSLTYLSLADYPSAYKCLSILEKESNWSKASYAYGTAATLYESLHDPDFLAKRTEDEIAQDRLRVRTIMSSIPGHMQKIAGKSLPFEKYVARKSRKYLAQNDRLALAGLELAYMLNGLNLAPRSALCGKHLKQVDDLLADLHKRSDGGQTTFEGYWDDFCLAQFLRAVVIHLIVRPEEHVKLDLSESPMSQADGDKEIAESFQQVIANSTKLELDHHIAWFAHFEYGRFLMKLGPSRYAEAKEHLSTVLENRVQLGPTKGKGKASMQNVVILRANASMDLLKAQMKE